MPEQYIEALRVFIASSQSNLGQSLGDRMVAEFCVKLVAAERLKADEDETIVGYAGGLIVSADTDESVFEAVTFLVANGLHGVCGTSFFEVTDLGEIGPVRSSTMPYAKLFGVRLTAEVGTSDMRPE